MGHGIGRIELENLAQAQGGLGQRPLGKKDVGQVVVGMGVMGIQAERFAVALGCLGQLSLIFEGVAEVDMRISVKRIDAQRLPKAQGCLNRPPTVHEDQAQVGVPAGVTRIEGDGLTDQINGRFVVAGLMGQKTQEMEGRCVCGLGLKNLPVERLRLAQVAAPMVMHGQVKQLGSGRHAS
jgi:hypothetical protein